MKAALIIFVVVIIIFAIVIVKTPIKDVLVESIKMFKNISEQNETYREADIEELIKLDDHDLYEAIGARLLSKIDVDKNYEISYSSFNEYEQTFWVVYEFDAEVLNGGLCQYFGNTRGRDCDRIVGDLKKIGVNNLRVYLSAQNLLYIWSKEYIFAYGYSATIKYCKVKISIGILSNSCIISIIKLNRTLQINSLTHIRYKLI